MTGILKKAMSVAAGFLVLLGCSSGDYDSVADNAADISADTLVLRIAVMPTVDCLPVYVAYESGIFERESLSVALIPFTAHMDCDTAMAGGSVHAMPTDLVRGERLASQGTPLRYVAATDLQWQLLAAKTARIKRLPQMDDKMMAMTRYSATAMMADHLVDSARLDQERVFRIQVNDVLVRLNMMETGIMDAVLLPEPQATVARSLDCSLLYDSGADSLAMGVIAFSEKALRDSLRRQQMETFVRACDEACDSINTLGLDHYRQLIAARCHVNEAMVDSMIAQHPPHFTHSRKPSPRDRDLAKKWLLK